MNRAERRKLPPPLAALASTLGAIRCPDCNNDTGLRQDANGMWHIDVLHDDTCPWYRAHQAADQ